MKNHQLQIFNVLKLITWLLEKHCTTTAVNGGGGTDATTDSTPATLHTLTGLSVFVRYPCLNVQLADIAMIQTSYLIFSNIMLAMDLWKVCVRISPHCVGINLFFFFSSE